MIREWKKTALLVIDMQKAFVEPGQPLCVAGAQKTVPELIRTVSYVREHGGRIVWIRREYEADGSDMEPFRREKMQTAGTALWQRDAMEHSPQMDWKESPATILL